MGFPDQPTDRRHLFFAFSLAPSSNTRRAFAFGLGGSWWAGGVGGLLEFIGRTNNSIRAPPPPLFFYFRPPFFPRHFLPFPPLFFAAISFHCIWRHRTKSRKGETGGNGLRKSSSPTPLFCATSFPFLVVCLQRTPPSPAPSRHTRAKKGISANSARFWAERSCSPRNEKGPSLSEGKERVEEEREHRH